MAHRIVLLGPPGCGKGTYAKYLAPLLNANHVSTGDLIRTEINKQTPLGLKFMDHNRRGTLAPDDLIFSLMNPILECSGSFILDGFPRTISQAKILQDICPVNRILFISMRKDVLIKKSIARRLCRECNISFNLADICEPNFHMPAVLPNKTTCITRRCIDRLVQREVLPCLLNVYSLLHTNIMFYSI